MKSFTLDLLHSDEEVHYRDYRINGHKFAFDQIQYNKGGPHNMERIAVPVISKSEAKDELEKMGPPKEFKKTPQPKTVGELDAAWRGIEDGRKFDPSNKLEEKKQEA